MKKKYLYTALIGIMPLCYSCVDLDKMPLEQQSDQSYWKTCDDATKAVNELYTCYPEWDRNGILDITNAAFYADDAVNGIKWHEGNVAKGIYDPQDFSWKDNYNAIRKANIIITNTKDNKNRV